MYIYIYRNIYAHKYTLKCIFYIQLACASPADTQYEETISTLRFALSCSKITNMITKNEVVSNAVVSYSCYSCGVYNGEGSGMYAYVYFHMYMNVDMGIHRYLSICID
jgi:hypothetical protein